MNYTKTVFSAAVAIAVLFNGPSFAFAEITTTGGGSTAGSVSSAASTGGGSTAGNSSTAAAITATGGGSTAGSSAPATTGGGSTAANSSPATTGGGSTAGTISSPVTTGGGSTAGNISTPATTGGGSTAGTISSPVTTGGGSTAGTISTPVTTGGGSTAGNTSPVTTGGGSTAGNTTDPVTPPASGGTSGGSGIVTQTSGGGGTYSSGGGSIISLPALVSLSQCNYLTSYLKKGLNNPVDQVVRLQTFLKNTEGLNVDVTGFFDQKTFNAVSAFQIKYTPQVLTPWGIRNSTGFVYYTTRKRVNEIYCKATFSLTPAQIREIEAYRTAIQKGITPASGDVGIKKPTPSPSTIPTVLVDETTSTTTPATDVQTANAGKTSAARKVWNFVKLIFGRQDE